MTDLIFLLISGSGWAEEMRRRYPLEYVPLCEAHGEPKVRVTSRRRWRCRSCHRERTRAYREVGR